MKKILTLILSILLMLLLVSCANKAEDGKTPYIQDGYWYIDGVNTGVKAEGVDGTDGKDGNSILSIDLTSSNENFDTYTILFTNGETTTFTIKHSDNKNPDMNCECDSAKENKIVDLVIFMGQSNMAGRGDASQATVTENGHGFEFRAVSDPTRLYDIAEPFGINENRGVVSEDNKTGSLVSAFAESYYSFTNIPIVGVSASKGATNVDFWSPGGEALTEAISRYDAAKKYLLENNYEIRHQYMVWLQGEADSAQGTSAEMYKAKLVSVFNEMQKFGVEKCMLIRIGNNADNPTAYDRIMLAQTQLCIQSDDFVMISGLLAEMADRGMMQDYAHFTQEGYNLVGFDAGKNMAYYVTTGMEPYFYDSEFDCYYPFGHSTNPESSVPVAKLDISVSDSKYAFSDIGIVSDDKVTVPTGSSKNILDQMKLSFCQMITVGR